MFRILRKMEPRLSKNADMPAVLIFLATLPRFHRSFSKPRTRNGAPTRSTNVATELKKLTPDVQFSFAARRSSFLLLPRITWKRGRVGKINCENADTMRRLNRIRSSGEASLAVVVPAREDGLTNDSSLSVPGPMSRPYQPLHGAASRFFPWKRRKKAAGLSIDITSLPWW